MDRDIYDRLPYLQKIEFWQYIRDVRYIAGDAELYDEMTVSKYILLTPAQQTTWWSRFDSEFDTSFIPPDYIDRPSFWDGLGILAIDDNEETIEFEEDDDILELEEQNIYPVITLPPLEKELTCDQVCTEKNKTRAKNCAIIRKRVAKSLKKAGCPSRVLAMKGKRSKRCVTKRTHKKRKR